MTTIEEFQRMEVSHIKSILNSAGVGVPNIDYRSPQNKTTLVMLAFNVQQPEQTHDTNREEEVKKPTEEETLFDPTALKPDNVQKELDEELKKLGPAGLKYEIGEHVVKLRYGEKHWSTTLHQPIHRIIEAAKTLIN